MSDHDTIAAIATAPGRGGIGVVRVSGRALGDFTEMLTGGGLPARRASVRAFKDAQGETIDEGVTLFFPSPHSYTGEDVLELQGHGGPVVLGMLLRRCIELGARLAEPGEFTRRAFLNGRLDLAQAESVVDLIDATTSQAARCAVRSLRGEFSKRIQDLTAAITELRMLVEATIDFPEEEIDFLKRHEAPRRLQTVRTALSDVLEAARQGSLLREGMHIVLAGSPNVGKSSLLNQLAGEDLAIVTDVPGTTRDAIRQVVDLDGIPAHIVDTAGLRDSEDVVERIGVARSWKLIEDADAILLLVDARTGLQPADETIVRRLPPGIPRVTVMNKIDLVPAAPAVVVQAGATQVWLSAKTGEGVEALRKALLGIAGWEGHAETAFLARQRHLDALRGAAAHLDRAGEQASRLELFAEELRLAQHRLSSVTGEFTADDLLGEIFSRFCIGK